MIGELAERGKLRRLSGWSHDPLTTTDGIIDPHRASLRPLVSLLVNRLRSTRNARMELLVSTGIKGE
jgi:hypothetical protein